MAQVEEGHRSLAAPGLGASQATVALLEVLDERTDLTVHEVAPGRLSVSVTRRPGWALVACVATIWIAGLGLFFLLVRRTESGEIGVTDGPRGCIVTLPPIVDAATRTAIADALAPAAPEVPVPTGPVVEDHDGLDERTVARRELPTDDGADLAASPPAGAPVVPTSIELRFDAGPVRVDVGQEVVLGREPSTTGRAIGLVVPGDASTVSKAHLRASFDGTALTVEDLDSTNGSVLRPSSAANGAAPPEARLLPGAPAIARPGDVVVMGALPFVVQEVRA